MRLKLILHASTVTIIAGLFLPLAEAPVQGVVTYNSIAGTQSYFILAFALAGSLLLSSGRRGQVWLAALGIWLTMFFSTIRERLWPEDRSTVDAAIDTVTEPLRDLASDFYLRLTELQYGGVILLLGCVVFAIVSVLLIATKE